MTAAPAAGIVAVAGEDAGDVRAVAVVVVRGRLEIDEVDEAGDAARAEIVVPVADARIDDGDADARAVEAQRVADPARADGGPGPLERTLHRPVQTHALDPRQRSQSLERGVRDVGNLATDEAQPPPWRAPQGADRRIRRTPGGHPEDDARVPLRGAGSVPQLTVETAVARRRAAKSRGRRRNNRQEDNEGAKHVEKGQVHTCPRAARMQWCCRGSHDCNAMTTRVNTGFW